jgi:hypothetical protein
MKHGATLSALLMFVLLFPACQKRAERDSAAEMFSVICSCPKKMFR